MLTIRVFVVIWSSKHFLNAINETIPPVFVAQSLRLFSTFHRCLQVVLKMSESVRHVTRMYCRSRVSYPGQSEARVQYQQNRLQ